SVRPGAADECVRASRAVPGTRPPGCRRLPGQATNRGRGRTRSVPRPAPRRWWRLRDSLRSRLADECRAVWIGDVRGSWLGVEVGDPAAGDEDRLGARVEVERVSGPDDDIGVAADGQGAETVLESEDRGRVDGQGLDRDDRVEALLDGQRRLVDEEVDRDDRVVG